MCRMDYPDMVKADSIRPAVNKYHGIFGSSHYGEPMA